jgi:hypothetical protein
MRGERVRAFETPQNTHTHLEMGVPLLAHALDIDLTAQKFPLAAGSNTRHERFVRVDVIVTNHEHGGCDDVVQLQAAPQLIEFSDIERLYAQGEQ